MMCGCIAPDRLRPWLGLGLAVRVVPHCPGSAGSSAARACALDCRAAFYSHRCIPAAGGCRLGRTGSPGPASNRSPGSVTDRTRRATGPEIDPGRESGGTGHASGGIGREVGRRGIAPFGGGRRQGSARDHGSGRRRGATNDGAHAHRAGSDRRDASARRHSADTALHHDAGSARRRRSRRGANR